MEEISERLIGESAFEQINRAWRRMMTSGRYTGVDVADVTVGGESAVEELPVPQKEAFHRRADAPSVAYCAIAEEIGLDSPAYQEAKLERIIEEENLHVIDYEKVVGYLNNLCYRKNSAVVAEVKAKIPTATWIDMPYRYAWSWLALRSRDLPKQGDTTPERVDRGIYAKEVPAVPLMTVATIVRQMPEAKFFISEITRLPDPFLAVTVPGSRRMWVLERWDEPGFRDGSGG